MDAELAKQYIFKDYPDVVNTKQLSEMLGINKNTAAKLLKNGEIKSFLIGGRYHIPKIRVLEYMGF